MKKTLTLKFVGQAPALFVDYSIYNRSNTTQSFAAWEVTRVHPEVLTVYPSQKNKFKSPFPVTHKYGAVWLDYKQSPVTDGAAKLIGDGEEGWLAPYLQRQKYS